jgi:hypothetical protein
MIVGHTFELQTFEVEAFSAFVNLFLNESSGIIRGCEITANGKNIFINEGLMIIAGRIIEIKGQEKREINTKGYHVLIVEINLNAQNTEEKLNQVNIRTIYGNDGYKTTLKEDINNKGKTYQFELARFRYDDVQNRIIDLKVANTRIEYKNILKILEEEVKKIKTGAETVLKSTFDETLKNYIKKDEISIKNGKNEPTLDQLKEGEIYIQWTE